MTPSLARPIGALLLALVLAGCAGVGAGLAPRIEALLPADLILLGEQHDADDHRRIQRAFVETLADQGRLAALVLEMADSGRSTTALGRDASAAQVRDARQWHQAGWPWAALCAGDHGGGAARVCCPSLCPGRAVPST